MRPTRIKKGKKFYRMRKGKLVEIPKMWVGIVTHPQTIRKRQSKHIGKVRRIMQCWKRGIDYISRNNINSSVMKELD